ncbi:MAG: aldehyde dehydrogenase (NADP(+)) [Flavobacteriaceae bacterium]|jgi:NADP-dependent aldehyde dehydrogenase|nr:aldehyde dehydrogenase (NADP(+)) [Flavobacteriaceae bacterium]
MLTGKNYIGCALAADGNKTFTTFNPKENIENQQVFFEASTNEINQAVELAHQAFQIYRTIEAAEKSKFLKTIADEILNLGDSLIHLIMKEAGLSYERIIGERARTLWQLQMFADLLEEGSWVDATIDTAQPQRTPNPKPDLRKMLIPIGPVVVFGASNFPLAYSTAGGDTVSALAAGCPVIVKSHPMHAGVSELVASAIIKAAQKTGMPNGVFSNLNSSGIEVGIQLVKHPLVKAVGFTGSISGGRALFDLANQRPEPIPVFAEMGSINPVIILPKALQNSSQEIAKKYAQSITLGSGQFCTNPGLILGIKSAELDSFTKHLADEILLTDACCMLHPTIVNNFETNKATMKQQKEVTTIVSYEAELKKNEGRALILTVNGSTFLQNLQLHQEVFGPFSMVVQCDSSEEMETILNQLEGQLTGTIMAENDELLQYPKIVEALQNRVGRMIFNGVPTGVEVCPSMHHGGPYPSSTDSRFTAVGIHSIKRWVRPFTYQNWPNELLPKALQNENPLQINRLVNNIFIK